MDSPVPLNTRARKKRKKLPHKKCVRNDFAHVYENDQEVFFRKVHGGGFRPKRQKRGRRLRRITHGMTRHFRNMSTSALLRINDTGMCEFDLESPMVSRDQLDQVSYELQRRARRNIRAN